MVLRRGLKALAAVQCRLAVHAQASLRLRRRCADIPQHCWCCPCCILVALMVAVPNSMLALVWVDNCSLILRRCVLA